MKRMIKNISFQKVLSKKIERNNAKRKKLLKERRKKKLKLQAKNEYYANIRSLIYCYQDVIDRFMPKNLYYLITESKSPLKILIELSRQRTIKEKISIPRIFSIIDNPKESYETLKSITQTIVQQKTSSLLLDYSKCQNTDLLTQVFLDAVLKDWKKFCGRCNRAKLGNYMKLHHYGASGYNDNLIKMINSVGSPAVLNIRQVKFPDIIPFTLKYYDKHYEDDLNIETSDEAQITSLVSYVEACLNRVHKDLTPQAKQDLGDVIGETLNNASIHSTLSSRYVIGYFEDQTDEQSQSFSGTLHLVIMNFGQSIYERFKNPDPNININKEVVRQMESLSSHYNKNTLFRREIFHESTLWTLYSLQHRVSIFPDKKRGSGTIRFIEKFLNLSGEKNVNKSRLILYSGDSIIEFDGSYRLKEKINEEGEKMQIMAFNEEGDLKIRPDKNFVRYSKSYFPGTAIFAKIKLHSEILKENGD